MIEQAETGLDKLQENFQEFRARGIRTLAQTDDRSTRYYNTFAALLYPGVELSGFKPSGDDEVPLDEEQFGGDHH